MAGFTSLRDRFDGGGAGASGRYSGMGLISDLGNLLFKRHIPQGGVAPAMAAIESQPTVSTSGFTGIGGEPMTTAPRPVMRPAAATSVQTNQDSTLPLVPGMAPRPVLRPGNPQMSGPVQTDLTSLLAGSQGRDLQMNTDRIAALGSLLGGGGVSPAMAAFDPLVPASSPNYDDPDPAPEYIYNSRGGRSRNPAFKVDTAPMVQEITQGARNNLNGRYKR